MSWLDKFSTPATTQDGLVFLLVRFLLESSLPTVN